MRRANRAGKRRGGPWYGEDRQRLVFERNARRHLPGLRARTIAAGSKSGRLYEVILGVPHYEARSVEVFFPKNSPRHATVTADGPTDSPHRYGEHRLCMWDPSDSPERRWVFEDGLLTLLGMTTAHLFREAWWRETGEWLGPEAPHARLKDADSLGQA